MKAYIQNLKFALNNGAKINFRIKRLVDDKREERYTNQYTVNTLFPNENPVEALRKELLSLTAEDYIQTVKDLRFPNRSEMREFGKVYNDKDEGTSIIIFAAMTSSLWCRPGTWAASALPMS